MQARKQACGRVGGAHALTQSKTDLQGVMQARKQACDRAGGAHVDPRPARDDEAAQLQVLGGLAHRHRARRVQPQAFLRRVASSNKSKLYIYIYI